MYTRMTTFEADSIGGPYLTLELMIKYFNLHFCLLRLGTTLSVEVLNGESLN